MIDDDAVDDDNPVARMFAHYAAGRAQAVAAGDHATALLYCERTQDFLRRLLALLGAPAAPAVRILH